MQNKNEKFKLILNKYSDTVYKIALTRCKNKESAEDVYQNVFLKYSEKMPKFKNENHEKAWFIKVTINMSKNEVNTAWNRKVDKLDDTINNLPFKTNENENADDIFAIVNNLPQNYKTAIYLMYYEGYKINEISKIMNSTDNTIKTWLYRARQILKDKIKGGFENE